MQLIAFYPAADLEKTRAFYEHLLGLKLVRDQGTCLIFEVAENAYLGFCEHLQPIKDLSFIITLITADVDGAFETLRAAEVLVEGPPSHNEHYGIYHVFARDPNGYRLELQRFDKPL